MTISITIEKDKKFDFEVFYFYINDRFEIFLNSYCYFERPTKRHKGTSVKYYNRLMKRDSNMEVKDVPLTDGIKNKVIARLTEKITFKTNN